MAVNIAEQYEGVRSDLKRVSGELEEYAGQSQKNYDSVAARLQAVEQLAAEGVGGFKLPGTNSTFLTFGASALDAAEGNQAFENLKDWNQGTARLKLDAPLKAALVTDGSGSSTDGFYNTPAERGQIVVGGGRRAMRLLDALPTRKTTSDAVEFVQVSAAEDAGEQILEGDAKQELNASGSLVRAEIATVAAFTAASRQVLSDNEQLQAAIDRMIRYKLLTKLENLLVNSTTATGKIDGLINQATALVPSLASTKADAIGESLVRQADAGYMPNLILLNSLDWFNLQTLKETGGDYIFGSPAIPVPAALWNAAIVASPVCPQGTALTIDTGLVTVLDREQPNIMLSNSHADFFTRNLIAILGELRAGLEVLDQGAIYKIDLSDSGLV